MLIMQILYVYKQIFDAFMRSEVPHPHLQDTQRERGKKSEQCC